MSETRKYRKFTAAQRTEIKIGAYIDRYHHRPHSRLAYRTPREVAAPWKDHDDQSISAGGRLALAPERGR